MQHRFDNVQRFSNFYIDFHEKLFNVQVKCMHLLSAGLPFQKFNKINISERISAKKPVLDSSFLSEINEEVIDQLFDLVFPVFQQYAYWKKEELTRLSELYDRRRFLLKDFLIALLCKDESKFQQFNNDYNISVQFLKIFTELTSAPFLELCAETFSEQMTHIHWNEPFCPICGSAPAFSSVDEKQQKRTLWCRRCNNAWTFSLDTCPFCRISDLKLQKFLFISDNKPYRVDACDNCGNYLKTLNQSLWHEKVDFSVLNIATFYLDIFAKYMGYNLNEYLSFYFELNNHS